MIVFSFKSTKTNHMRKYLFEKIPVLLLVTGMVLFSSGLFAQIPDGKLTLDFRNTSLKEVVDYISENTDFKFIYTDKIGLEEKKVSIKCYNEKPSVVFDRIFLENGILYVVKNNQVILSLKENAEDAKRRVKVSGIVSEDGGPLPGVLVAVKNDGKLRTVTDLDGKYNIEVPSDAVLVFSFMGMETEERAVNSRTTLNVKMSANVSMLDDVVVTGYQEVSRNQSTSSVSVVKTDKLNLTGVVSITEALQGQIAGLSIVNASAGLGAAPKVRVRGTSTIMGSPEPLWVLDGVILENSVPVTPEELNSPDFLNTFNSAIGGVSPNDIESITVLKDASATAIYGTRAANGVIVVTTKKGRANQPRFSYSHSSKISLRPSYNDFNLMNSKESVAFNLENTQSTGGVTNLLREYLMGNISKDEYVAGVRVLQERNTDWFGILYRNAYTQTHDMSYSGGTERMNYYVSLNYSDEQGLDKISDYSNLGGMAKVNAEIFKGVELGVQLHVSRRMRNSYMSYLDPFTYAVTTSRTLPLYNEDGSYAMYNNYNQSAGGKMFNILYEQENSKKQTEQSDMKGNVTLDIDIYKGLKYKGLVSYSGSNSKNFDYAKETTAYVSNIRGYDYGDYTEEEFADTKLPYGGIYNESSYVQKNLLIRNTLDYSKVFAGVADFNVMLGHEFRNNEYTGLISKIYGYMHDRGSIFNNPQETADFGHVFRNTSSRSLINRSNESYFGIMSLMYKDKYVINGNVRFDGSNLFGSNPKYRYLPLWSVSAKYILSNENFMHNAGFISYLALRGSYGLRGNIVEESSPQIIASALPPNESTGLLEMIINQPPNPDLKWETTASLNIGMDMSLFNGRLNLTADYFMDKSSDLIAFNNISAVSGFLGKYVNYADIMNHGLDLSLSGDIIRTGNTTWSMSVNMGYVKNEVLKSSITPSVSSLVSSIYSPGNVMVGYPVNGMFAYRYAGLDNEGLAMFYDSEGNVVGTKDEALGALVNDITDLVYVGPREPVITGGFNNILKIRDFTLSCLFSFGLGGKIRLPDVAYMFAPNSNQNANRSILNAWKQPGDENNPDVIPSLSGSSYFYGADGNTYYTTDMYNKSDACIVSGDYFRLKNVTLEYRFPKSVLKHLRIKDSSMSLLSLRFQASNLFVLKDKRLEGYDPETVNFSTSGYGSLPLPKTFSIGLNLNF